MPWDRTPGTRRDLPPDWPQIVKKCKEDAGGRCEWILPSGRRCPRPGTDVDHYGKKWEHRKVRLLCRKHHNDHTAKQALAARTGPRRKTRPQQHPGSLR